MSKKSNCLGFAEGYEVSVGLSIFLMNSFNFWKSYCNFGFRDGLYKAAAGWYMGKIIFPFHSFVSPLALLIGMLGKNLPNENLPRVTITMGFIVDIWESR